MGELRLLCDGPTSSTPYIKYIGQILQDINNNYNYYNKNKILKK